MGKRSNMGKRSKRYKGGRYKGGTKSKSKSKSKSTSNSTVTLRKYKELEDASDEIERFCSKVDVTLRGTPISFMGKVDNVRKK